MSVGALLWFKEEKGKYNHEQDRERRDDFWYSLGRGDGLGSYTWLHCHVFIQGMFGVPIPVTSSYLIIAL